MVALFCIAPDHNDCTTQESLISIDGAPPERGYVGRKLLLSHSIR